MIDPVIDTLEQVTSRPWAERNGFPRWLMALVWVLVAFVLFQLTGAVVTIVLLLAKSGGALDVNSLMTELNSNLDLLFIGNSTGQILVLGLGTWGMSRVVSGAKWKNDVRLTANSGTAKMALMAFLLIVAVQPLVILLGWVNLQFPFSESYLEFERSQNVLLEGYLRSDHFLPLTLVHVALVPAICEELLMRGYAFRYFERSAGVIGALVISSVIFGFFHVKLTQVIPLSALGLVLAYVTLKSNSIWPAVLAHFVNNAANVVLARFYPELIFEEFTPENLPEMWLVLLSFAAVTGLVYAIHHQSKKHVFQTG